MTCEVSSVAYLQPTVQWRVNGSLLMNTNGVVIYQIPNFQLSNEGDYSCVVTTKYWSVSSDTVNVKIAGVCLCLCLCVCVCLCMLCVDTYIYACGIKSFSLTTE